MSAVLAELDGTGVPLCYLFYGNNGSDIASSSNVPGSSTSILEQFLKPLRDAGFNPSFFGCDKDKAEITAIQKVWPGITVQLCFWHAKRAIKMKLRSLGKTSTQKQYLPHNAQALIPTLEICRGSLPTRRPNGDHESGRCNCASSTLEFEEFGSLETTIVAERDTVLQMFSRHFNMHSMIPDKNGTKRSATQIHLDCINEIYIWCHSRNYFRLWAYLYINWYSPEQWRLWARSSNPISLPVLKITMIIESHWRRTKHDFLHRFNLPRTDLVTWVLVSRVVPTTLGQMNTILVKNHRRAIASWRKPFKREWKRLQNSEVDSQSLLRNHTDPSQWTCACNAFLLSRFLLCKHIVSCYEKPADPTKFFFEVRRQRCCPFWVGPNLVLRPQFQTAVKEISTVFDTESGSDTEYSDDKLGNTQEEKDSECEDEDPREHSRRILSSLDELKDLVQEQGDKLNSKWLQKFDESNASDMTLLEENNRLKRSRSMPRTWVRSSHPATLYRK